MQLYRNHLKRLFDLIGSIICLVLFSPVSVFLIIILTIAFRGKPFFIQHRPGWKEQDIRIIKFKSMNDNADDDGNLLSNFERTTKLGGFIRRTSLDELPQLLNVIKGDLSLVGPRPLLNKYLPLYNKTQRRRHDVRPGITGLAQVNGRNAILWKQKFEYDVFYVDNLSFRLDLRILFLTIIKVVHSEGVNSNDNVTMPPFNGNN